MSVYGCDPLPFCLYCRGVESDIEQVMQKHREMQDQIAEDMLQSVSALKHNSLAARSTIEKDSEVGMRVNGGLQCECDTK